MITLGLDPHPGGHTVVALDENGASLGYLAVPNTPQGVEQLHEFAARFFSRRGRKKNDVVDAENVARALLANLQLAQLHAVEQQRELQELTRTQRRLSEQLTASRGALQELTAESPVRKVIQPVIQILIDQLEILEQQIRTIVNNLMPCLLDVPGVGPIVAGVLLAETGDPRRFPSANATL